MAVLDGTGAAVPAGMVCHLPCNPTAPDAGCPVGERCLRSTASDVAVDTVDGGLVFCGPDAGAALCNADAGLRCLTTGLGRICARVDTACGRPIPAADLQPLADGGVRAIPDSELCNLGPAEVDLAFNVILSGSRLCDDYPQLASPPAVRCEPIIAGAPPGVGVCRADCLVPANDGLAAVQSQCPAGAFCSMDQGALWLAQVDGQDVPCTTETACSPLAAQCTDLGAGASFCTRPGGICQPLSGHSPSGGTPDCGAAPQGAGCVSSAQCACDLACVSSMCMKPCSTPAVVAECAPGQLCAGPLSNGGAYCADTRARDENCAGLSVCLPGLSCQGTVVDAQARPL